MKNKVILISAICKNNELGKNNKLLFKLKEDLGNFKKLTSENVVVMGRKTFESLNSKPLPNRINIVLSRNANDDSNAYDNLIWKKSLEDAIDYANKNYEDREIYIIGGGYVYKMALEKGIVDEMVITKIDSICEDADTYFPYLDYDKEWIELSKDEFVENNVNYAIYRYKKKF